MFSFFNKKFRHSSNHWSQTRGFTLMELIVVIAIFLIITGVVLTDIPSFRRRSSLDLVASEVATYIRGAQVYGTAQKVSGLTASQSAQYSVELTKGANFFNLYNDVKSPTHTSSNYEEHYDFSRFNIAQLCDPDYSPYRFSHLIIAYSGSPVSSLGLNLHPTFRFNETVLSSYRIQIKIVPFGQDENSTESRCVTVYKNGQIALTGCLPCPG